MMMTLGLSKFTWRCGVGRYQDPTVWIKQGQLDKAQTWVNKQGFSTDDEPSYLHEFDYLTLASYALLSIEILMMLMRFSRRFSC